MKRAEAWDGWRCFNALLDLTCVIFFLTLQIYYSLLLSYFSLFSFLVFLLHSFFGVCKSQPQLLKLKSLDLENERERKDYRVDKLVDGSRWRRVQRRS